MHDTEDYNRPLLTMAAQELDKLGFHGLAFEVSRAKKTLDRINTAATTGTVAWRMRAKDDGKWILIDDALLATDMAQRDWEVQALLVVANVAATLEKVGEAPETARHMATKAVSTVKREAREVPPGEWKVDMPDGTYCKMPGDPPGPGDIRAVIGGYVYNVEPRTGKLRASLPPKPCPSCTGMRDE